jgi:hypothetical protein
MGKAYNGSITQAQTLTKNDDSPLDDRTVVQNKTDLTTSSVWIVSNTDTRYEGMLVYVDSSDTNRGLYVLSNHANRNSDSGWTKIKDSDVMRVIQVGGTTILGSSSSTPLNLIAGANITLTPQQNEQQEYTGAITIASSGGGGSTGGVASVTISTGLSLNGTGAGTIHGDESGTITLKRASVFSASNAEIGGIKIGGELSEISGAKTNDSGLEEHRYAVLIDSNDLAYVYVPTVSPNDSTITLRGGSSSSYREIDTFTTNQSTSKTIYVPIMSGATASSDGNIGLVPKPLTGYQNKYLRGDGTWQDVSSGTTNTFNTIAVSGQSPVVADTSTDTLTLVAGNGVNITTNASTDTITFSATGGGGSSKEHMQVYYFIDEDPNHIYKPFEALCNLFSNIFSDNKTNDIHSYVDAVIRYSTESGYDGHIPLGAIILLYGMYLIEMNVSTGRFIYESNGYGDYWNYIISDNESPEMWAYSSCTTQQVLTQSNIFLVTSNWGGTLPIANNAYNSEVSGAAGQYSTSTSGNIQIPSIGGETNSNIWHKYTFNFANVSQGDMYNDPSSLSKINDFILALKTGNIDSAQTAFGKLESFNFFSNKASDKGIPGMLVTVQHESSVGYHAQLW